MAASATPAPLPATAAANHREALLILGGILGGMLTGGAVVLGDLLGGAIAWVAGLMLPLTLLVLGDFRLGVLGLMLLFPLAASPLLPHAILGVTGLNPLNLLLALSLLSALLAARTARGVPWARLGPLAGLYLLPLVVAGLLGARHVADIPVSVFTDHLVEFTDATGYLRDMLAKPLLLVVLALLAGWAVAQSQKPERFLLPLALAAALPAVLIISYVAASGAALDSLASEEARGFLSPLGLHANDLGRLLAIAYALLLFSQAGAEGLTRMALVTAMALVAVALMLTFSRSALIGFVLITFWFVLTRRPGVALAGLLIVPAALALLPDAVFQRLFTGLDSGLNAVSAGRVDNIWLPLVPDILAHPFFGQGLGATLWSTPMREGAMLPVSHPHNAYLQLLLDVGLVGSVMVLAYFGQVWRHLGQAARDTAAPALSGFFRGAQGALAMVFITGMTGSSFAPCPEQVFLWLAIGFALGISPPTPASLDSAR